MKDFGEDNFIKKESQVVYDNAVVLSPKGYAVRKRDQGIN